MYVAKSKVIERRGEDQLTYRYDYNSSNNVSDLDSHHSYSYTAPDLLNDDLTDGNGKHVNGNDTDAQRMVH